MKYLRKPFKYTYKNAVLIIALINAGVFVFTSLFRNLSAYLGTNLLAVFHLSICPWGLFSFGI